jgi:hypothetical protein
LTTPVGERVPVRVFERGSDLLMLVMMLESGEQLHGDPAEPLLLEYESVRGLVRFHGEAQLDGSDLIRFHVHDEPEVLQRREFVRVDAAQPVVIATEDGDVPVATHAIDISGGGMLLSGPGILDIDTKVRFRLDLGPAEPPIDGLARVVRATENGRRALMFEEISRADRQRLIHFVFDRQREARAKTISGRRRNGRKARKRLGPEGPDDR